MHAVTGSSGSHLNTQLEEMELSRAHESLVTTELDKSKQHWQQLRKTYKKSRIQYENAIDPFTIQPDAVSGTQNVARLRERFIIDWSLLESYAADVKKMKRRLQAARISRSRCELVFMQAARQWTRSPTGNALAWSTALLGNAPTLPRTSVPSFTSPPEVDFLLEHYHSTLAAVSSLGQRLANLNYEYWNEVACRELLRDHEEALNVGDDDFEGTFELDKTDILQELRQAMEEAYRLKIECVSAGASVQDLKPVDSTFTCSHNLTVPDTKTAYRLPLPEYPLKLSRTSKMSVMICPRM